MGLYNFQPQFVPFILDGSKTHTIRGVRVNPDRPGSKMHLYTGLRRKGAQLLFVADCVKVEAIQIDSRQSGSSPIRVVVDEHELDRDELRALAHRDGFRATDSPDAEMLAFWWGRLPFVGHVYHWRKP